jgi:hypothetical protein
MTELTESIRAAAITAVTDRIAELQCCGHATPDRLEVLQRLLAGPARLLNGAQRDCVYARAVDITQRR